MLRQLDRMLEWLDGRLDTVPSYEEGRWYRYGDWGCKLSYRFSALRWWDRERR
jgi:hypothetical protein